MSVWQGLLDIAERSRKDPKDLRLEQLEEDRKLRTRLDKERRDERAATLKQLRDTREAARIRLKETKRRQLEEQVQRTDEIYSEISKAYTENVAQVLKGLDNGTYAEDVYLVATKLIGPFVHARNGMAPIYQTYGINRLEMKGSVAKQAAWLEHIFGSTAEKWIEAHMRFRAKNAFKELKEARKSVKETALERSTFTEMLLGGRLRHMMLSRRTQETYERLTNQLKEFDDEQRKANADRNVGREARMAQGGISDPDPSRTGYDHRSDAFIRDADVQHAWVRHSS